MADAADPAAQAETQTKSVDDSLKGEGEKEISEPKPLVDESLKEEGKQEIGEPKPLVDESPKEDVKKEISEPKPLADESPKEEVKKEISEPKPLADESPKEEGKKEISVSMPLVDDSLKDGVKKVTIRVVFLKISEIETVKERFSAEAFIQAKWREPSLDDLMDSPKKVKALNWDDFWNPKLTVVNAVGELQEIPGRSVIFNAEGEATVCERRKIKGRFYENLELKRFPFDTQDLSLTISSLQSTKDVTLVADDAEPSSIHLHSFIDQQEWTLYKHVVTAQGTFHRTEEAATERHPSLTFTCRASRKIGFFVWNVFFVMFFICSMTFTTFAVSLALLPNRIQLTLILLLTTMTYKFSVNQYVPKISYLTYLDSYILTAMVTICLICAWHALVGGYVVHAVGEKDAFWIDKYVLLVFVGVYFGGHVFLVVVVFVVVSNSRTEDEKAQEDYLRQVFLLAEKPHQFTVEVTK